MTTGESKKMACGTTDVYNDLKKEIRRLKRENKKLQAAKEEQEAAAKLATEHGLEAIRERKSAEIQLTRAQTAAAKAMVLEAERDEARQQRDQARIDLEQSRRAQSTPYSRELDTDGFIVIRTGPNEVWVRRERFACVVAERDRLVGSGLHIKRDEDSNEFIMYCGRKWVPSEDEKKRDEKYAAHYDAMVKKERDRRYKAEDAAEQLRKEINDVRTKWGEFLASDSSAGKVAAAEAQVSSLRAEVKTAYAKVKEHNDAIGQLRRWLVDTAASVCTLDNCTRTWLYDQPAAIRDWLSADCVRGYFLRSSTGSYAGFRPSSLSQNVYSDACLVAKAPETVTVYAPDGPHVYVPESKLKASETAHAGIVKANIELRCKADRCDRAEQVLADVRKAMGETSFFVFDAVTRAKYLVTQVEQVTDALERERKAHTATQGQIDALRRDAVTGYVSYWRHQEVANELATEKKARQAAETARNAAEAVKTEALRTVKELEPFMAIVNNVRPMIRDLLPHFNG